MKKFALAIAAAGLALTGTQVSAGEVEVSYADLNLASVEGQKALERRIANAIEEVCQTNTVPTGSHIRSRESRQCAKMAKAKAKQQVAAIVARGNLGG